MSERQKVSDNWLGTNNGRRIVLAAPNPSQIDLDDIADGLSHVCRFNGQIKEWYSVAEHSIHVAELVPDKYKGVALFHDATEAYLCDVPTPLKRELEALYKPIEERLARVIAQAMGMDQQALVDLPEQVQTADTIMAVTERDHLQKTPQVWPEKYETALRYPRFRVKYKTPAEARKAWLEMVNKWVPGASKGSLFQQRQINPYPSPIFSGEVGVMNDFQVSYDELYSDGNFWEPTPPGEAAENW